MKFEPYYTPIEMMRMGVFGGTYFDKATSEDFKHMSPDIEKMAKTQTGRFDTSNNYFKVKAGLSLQDWQQYGWILAENPLGWFQWYCRYTSGYRHPTDQWYIDRWIAYGKRWGNRKVTEGKILSPVIKQGLLQWSIKV